MPHPLDVLGSIDPELLKLVGNNREFILGADGALPKKVKYLIAMALDAAHGASDGVRSLATAAKNAGATAEEIGEALRVAYYIAGAGSVYTAARGLKDVF